METEEWALFLAFFGLLAFLAFLATRTTTTPTTASAPYLLIEKDERGRIVSVESAQ